MDENLKLHSDLLLARNTIRMYSATIKEQEEQLREYNTPTQQEQFESNVQQSLNVYCSECESYKGGTFVDLCENPKTQKTVHINKNYLQRGSEHLVRQRCDTLNEQNNCTLFGQAKLENINNLSKKRNILEKLFNI